MVDRKSRFQLIAVLGVVSVLIAAFGALLTCALIDVPDKQLQEGLTNVSTIGGIVSGLSLSGTAVLALGGRYTSQAVGKYGSAIRFILFGGFTILVAASLLCAIAVIWVDQMWTRFVLGFTIPLMLLTLIVTAFLINSAFAWNEPRRTMRTSDPYSTEKLARTNENE